ncbi:MAG: (Fe-S)-binding protein [Planctomycetota bacterium]|nr:(Fe-S)-binding protein [Planctomycetota bacterium]
MDLQATLTAVLVLSGVCLVFGVLIATAHSRLKVWEDPRIDVVTEMLPGSNCGACGFAGCRAFAEGLIDESAQPAGCTQMTSDAAGAVAGFLGVDAGSAVKRVARLLCAGGSNVAIQQAEYRGMPTCGAAAVISSGGKGCSWGCIGLGDCDRACDYDAIHMDEHGLPRVTIENCTACGDCVEACPKDLFVVQPVDHKLLVQCKSLLEGDEALELCSVACNACGRCALDADEGVVTMENGLAVVHYEHNDRATSDAIERCPTGAITWVEGAQFATPRALEMETAR